MKELESDILIIGGGLTGLMTAFALSSLKINIILIDKHNLTDSKNFYKDYRTTAVAEGSKVFFEKINIWSKLKKYANPIKTIKVFDRTEDRKIHFHNQIEKNNLGYIIRNNIIKKILLKYLKRKKNVQLFNNLPLDKISSSNEHIFANTNRFTFKSKLIIAADGKQSHVRSILKTYRYFKKYNHRALVVNFNHSLNHNNTAYEIFLETGPLAILPMMKTKNDLFSSSIIWSNEEKFISNLEKLNKNLLISILIEQVGKYVGDIKEIVDIQSFNLSAHINTKFYDQRLIYIGDSAHSIHPIAGQGWNLGVRDVKNLLEVLENAKRLGLDLGNSFTCKQYHDKSFYDSLILYQITDKFNSVFLDEKNISKALRDIGFTFIEKNKKLKNFITNFAMGI